jgi:uncharacterized membrane protein YhaH (DUF805 family)
MSLSALFFSAHGRLPPKPFGRAIVVVYGVACLSQILVSPLLLQWIGWLPFAAMVAIAAWAWFCLHAKRLRDAGSGIRPAAAITMLYVLAMVLLLLLALLLAGATASDATSAPTARLSDFLLPAVLLAQLSDDAGLGLFAYVLVGMLLLIVIPIAMAIGFSIWSGSRASVAASPPPS